MDEAGSGDPEHSSATRTQVFREQDDGRHPMPPAAVIPIRAPLQSMPPATSRMPISPPSQAPHSQLGPITFNQSELRLIFGLYGRKVAAGEWRDYAMDFLRDQAIFSIYRRSSEVPLYRVEKTPRLARKQGEYAAVAASGLILKRGSDLARVLAVLDKPLKIVR